jgi:hypothetical protein
MNKSIDTNLDRSTNGKFKKGHAPWNKGMKGLQIGGKKTRFKPGHIPRNCSPVGAIRILKDGYLEIKTAMGRDMWVLLNRWNWKQHYGEYPPKGSTLVFKDGNKQNCEIDNLELLSRSELMQKNSLHRLPKEIAEICRLRGALNRKINEKVKHEQ